MLDGYNKELCDERHEFIQNAFSEIKKDSKEAFEKVDARLKIIDARFIAIMTALVVTLVGVAANLLVQLVK
jgi:hypothetical protein